MSLNYGLERLHKDFEGVLTNLSHSRWTTQSKLGKPLSKVSAGLNLLFDTIRILSCLKIIHWVMKASSLLRKEK